MIYRFHPYQFTCIDDDAGTVVKINLTPMFTPLKNIKVQPFVGDPMLSCVLGIYQFRYVKGAPLDQYFKYHVSSIILSLLFNLLEKTFVCHNGIWYSWLDDYNQSNFILSEEGELVVIDWLEAQWYEVTPEWCIYQMKKLCGVKHQLDSLEDHIIDYQLKCFLEDHFEQLVPYYKSESKNVDRDSLIPMRSAWMYEELINFRRPAFIECQQYRILNNKENDTTIDLGPFDTIEKHDQMWYNWIRTNLI